MKKSLKLFAVASLVWLAACSKKEVSPSAGAPTKASQEWTVFNTVSEYEALLAQEPEKRFSTLKTSRSTLASPKAELSVDTALYQSEFLKQLLNHDAIVQIQDWLIKVDVASNQVFVLNTQYASEYEDLKNGNSHNPHIQVYATEDDVLDLLQNNQPSSAQRISGLSCGDRRANGKRSQEFEQLNADNTQRLDCKVVYQTVGIYFSLQAKSKVQQKLGGVWVDRDWSEMTLYYKYGFTPRCRSYQSADWYTKESGNSVNHRPYESTRALKNYSYTVQTQLTIDNSTYTSLIYTIAD